MLILLGLSYYLRARIGTARWRSLHRFTALAWVLGVAHAVGEGTDASAAWFLVAAAAVVVPAGALLAARLAPATLGSPASAPAASSMPSPTPLPGPACG